MEICQITNINNNNNIICIFFFFGSFYKAALDLDNETEELLLINLSSVVLTFNFNTRLLTTTRIIIINTNKEYKINTAPGQPFFKVLE